MNTTFLLNGEKVSATTDPTTTLLDWLRETRHLTGTKEGCNEGDCGACTVMVSDPDGPRALNACILFVPQLHGKSVRTVEGLAAPDGTPHPVQSAMIEHHGSQCGFCTPGFVVSMAVNHSIGNTDHATTLAGNLCRCTGYAPILRAAEAVEEQPVPDHLWDAQPDTDDTSATEHFARPTSSDQLAAWYKDNPDATLIGGATDVGLWVTKGMRDVGPVAFLNACEDLKGVDITPDLIRIRAATTLTDLSKALASDYPSLSELIRRYGSTQVRNAATIGGNIANGSPIGDGSPALIALSANVHLRYGDTRRVIPLEDFFLEYGKQDRKPGEFVEALSFPNAGDHLHCYKISKRFDQDISAVCACLWIKCGDDGSVSEARLAYGGMAGIPRRAYAAEAVLIGQPFDEQHVRMAMSAMKGDFTPLSDMRASAEYRMETAQNMLLRAWHERQGQQVNVQDVTP